MRLGTNFGTGTGSSTCTVTNPPKRRRLFGFGDYEDSGDEKDSSDESDGGEEKDSCDEKDSNNEIDSSYEKDSRRKKLVVVDGERKKVVEVDKDTEDVRSFPIGQYVTAVYQGDWYVGQVVDKKGEIRAIQESNYFFVSYMERVAANVFKWPAKVDKLNTLKEDILHACQPPMPSTTTSSSRNITFSLSKEDHGIATTLFNKAYYQTIFFQSDQLPVPPIVCVLFKSERVLMCVCVTVGTVPGMCKV